MGFHYKKYLQIKAEQAALQGAPVDAPNEDAVDAPNEDAVVDAPLASPAVDPRGIAACGRMPDVLQPPTFREALDIVMGYFALVVNSNGTYEVLVQRGAATYRINVIPDPASEFITL